MNVTFLFSMIESSPVASKINDMKNGDPRTVKPVARNLLDQLEGQRDLPGGEIDQQNFDIPLLRTFIQTLPK